MKYIFALLYVFSILSIKCYSQSYENYKMYIDTSNCFSIKKDTNSIVYNFDSNGKYYQVGNFRVYLTSDSLFYSEFFKKGILTGELFFRYGNPPDAPFYLSKNGDTTYSSPLKKEFNGKSLKILDFTRLNSNNKYTKKFIINVSFHGLVENISAFYLEITNKKGNKVNCIRDFIAGSEVICFQHLYDEL